MAVNQFSEELGNITLNHQLAVVQEQVLAGTVISSHMLIHDHVKQGGGMHIVLPIRDKTNTSVKNFSGSDSFGERPADLAHAHYDMFSWGGALTYDQDDLDRNMGPEALVNFQTYMIESLRDDIGQHVERSIVGKKGASGDAAKIFHGLMDIVGTKDNTIGGISTDGAADYWEPYHQNKSGTTLAMSDVHSMILNLSKGGTGYPTLIYSRIPLYEAANALLHKQQEYVDPKHADAGFQSIGVMGVPWVFLDEDIATHSTVNMSQHQIFFLQEKHIDFWCHSHHWMMATGFQRDDDSLAYKALITSKGTLVTNYRARHGRLAYNNGN